ncbi:GNAT family N-acetyltransferase [Vibrio gallaecicus]|uniref:GNAT family N-acetyltransferase n=1 Tax=Vibrio gallaecicus TaxID=552386 RepID=UPI001F0DDB48|nr:GNAT family N-acetyltransferase [Vibrio gallaecicus]MDN3617281.1 GNAT family N-acetyltransferase [Vibrio gallaecicus]
MAFSTQFSFSDLGGKFECIGSIVSYLIGRYVFGGEMVREATKDDCVKLAALSIKVWLDTYAREGIKTEYAEYVLSTFTATYFFEILDTTKYRVFVSEEQEVIQGYVMVNLESHYQTSGNGFEVEKLYVDNTFKGKGLGRKLLNEVENQLGNKYWLYTWVENESNGFYEHLGLSRIGLLTFEFAGASIENNVYQSAHT